MNSDLASIWKKYKDTADPESKAFLTEYYLPFVKNIASNIIKKVKFGVVEYGDLVNEGIIGLIKAIEQFDIDRGIKFETYAMSIVRGAIYNSIRALDWVPERTREKTRALQKAMDNFSVMHGREGSEAEIAKEMNMTTADVYNLISDLGCIYLLSLEQPVSSDEDEGMILDYVEDNGCSNPSEELEFKEQRQEIFNAIEALPERDSKIIKLRYFSGYSFDRIAQEIGISKQRVSQIHSRIIRQLRKSLSSSFEVASLNHEGESENSIFDTRA